MTIPVTPAPPSQVGLPVDKSQVDLTSGNLARTIDQWASSAIKFEAYLAATTDETLMAPPFNYSSDNIATLKSAFTDLALLARIYQGTDVLATARDLGTFSRRLAGIIV